MRYQHTKDTMSLEYFVQTIFSLNNQVQTDSVFHLILQQTSTQIQIQIHESLRLIISLVFEYLARIYQIHSTLCRSNCLQKWPNVVYCPIQYYAKQSHKLDAIGKMQTFYINLLQPKEQLIELLYKNQQLFDGNLDDQKYTYYCVKLGSKNGVMSLLYP